MTRPLGPLFQKVAATVADQGVTSSTNFLMNVLLARWLTRGDYGAFSVAWSFCLVFAAFHNALIVEPMTVIRPAEYADRLGAYLRRVGRFNWLVMAALSLGAAVTAVCYRHPIVQRAMLILALCLPGYLLLLTRRREQIVLHQPLKALRLSLVYGALVAAVLGALFWRGKLSALSGIAAIGVAWVPGLFGGRGRRDSSGVGGVAKENWQYGKWLFASSVLAVGIPDVQTILLSLLVDLKAAGALRALMNFILPLGQLMTAFNVYVLPRFSRRMKESGAGLGLRGTVLFPAVMVCVAAGYLGVLLIAGPWLERVLYNGKMAQYVVYLPPLACAAMLSVIAGGFSTLLRAAQNSRHQFVSGVTGTVVGVGSAFVLLKSYGLSGALWSMILANGAAAGVVVVLYSVELRRAPGRWALLGYFREGR